MLTDIRQQFQQRISSDGILQFFDSTRNKWLSTERSIYSFGINHVGAEGERWLYAASRVPTNNSGYKIPRDATITSLTIQAKQSGSGTFRVFVLRSGSYILMETVTLTAESGKVVDNLDIDIDQGDALTALLLTGGFAYPVLSVEIAWR